MFAIAFLTRIIYNIWCLVYQPVGNAYIIFSAFVYVICIAFPLLYVFTNHMLESAPKPESQAASTLTKEEYVGRLSAIEQNNVDENLRRVSDILGNDLESEDELPRFRENSLPFEGDESNHSQEAPSPLKKESFRRTDPG